MKSSFLILMSIFILPVFLQAQTEPAAGQWKTWFIKPIQNYRLPSPASHKKEIAQVIERQEDLDSAGLQQIMYWNAGSPGYRWQQMMDGLWMTDTTYNGIRAFMLLGVATYDATIAAWDTKYAFNRPRPFVANKKIKSYVPDPTSPSYPCEHSVAAGVAATIIAHFFPAKAEFVYAQAEQVMASRISAGAVFPSDTRAGFELGKRIAKEEIEYTKDFTPGSAWDGKVPDEPGLWKGKPMFPMAGRSRTIVLDSSSQFRPGPPPNFASEMQELKEFKPTYHSTANAFHYASQTDEVLHTKIFEYNLHLNPPRAARLYAIASIGIYDGFVACWDAKYAYWGTRPDQYDKTFRPVLFYTPPFPGYPSGHAMIGGVLSELYSYFFPAERAYFMKRAKDGAESRFHGGIHFRSDNEIGLKMGKKVGSMIIQRARNDGADDEVVLAKSRMNGISR